MSKDTLTKQSRRMLEYALTKPNTDIPAPELNAAAAGEGRSYVSSFSRRTHEVRREMQRRGGDFILSVDEWSGGQRQTKYKITLPTGYVENDNHEAASHPDSRDSTGAKENL
jgi:hypothetical protein